MGLRSILLKGEVPVKKTELERLRRVDAELQDYMAAIRSPEVQAVRMRTMAIRRGGEFTADEVAWAHGVADYESALEKALLRMLRERS